MLQNAIRTIRTFLPPLGSVTPEQIEQAVDTALSLPFYANLDRELVVREVQSIYNIRIDDFRIIESYERRHPWINETKASISWKFWNRYRDYLEVEKNFSPDVLGSVDRLTDRILDGLFNPVKNVIIDKRGLVVGQVQSGKTANYTGLICKAADSGYKLIIVLAGIHNNLRSQTQLRIDEGFLGFDTQHQRAFNQNNIWIGVGRSATNRDIVAHSLTSSLDGGDFNAGVANGLGLNFNTNEPIIAVVKKNVSVLRRLKSWLSTQTVELPDGRKVIRNKSLLLIDDEADNASINTNPDADRSTRINGLVRDILRMFDRSGYVGYTATPFANIFIPITEDDLFPRDFIINLPAPSNYIGPTRVFGTQIVEDDDESDTVLPVVRRISDYQDSFPNGHKKDDPLPASVPDSLKLAIKCFILTCAIRRLRGHNKAHNSMLIHVSRFIRWQGGIKTLVENVFDYYRRGIEMNIPSIIEEFRLAFSVDFGDYKSYITTSKQILDSPLQSIDSQIQVHDWKEVITHLNDAASRIMVREIHGGSADVLNYYDHLDGLSVIAIGGNKLSRGLTLEGLSVSYYLRASRMYDTLMQMGRWFGYRPGYVDLCRMFTSQELNEWFCHITLASEELREEFDYMSDVAGSTPEKYALRVRTHPGVLQISASNKIRRAVNVDISWAGRLIESYEFQKRPEIIKSNLLAAENFISSLLAFPNEIISGNYLWFKIGASYIKNFLQHIQLSENLKAADPANLLRFIDAQLINGELTSWRVAVMSKAKTAIRYPINKSEGNLDIGCYFRKSEPNTNGVNYYLRKSHIISPMDEVIDLTVDELKIARLRTEELWQTKGKTGSPSYPSGEIVRNEIRSPQNPLLIIYYLDPSGANLPVNSDPIVGYAISFPASKFDSAVSYAVHEQLLPIFSIDDEDLEENLDDED